MCGVYLCFVDESNHGDFFGFAAVVADEFATKSLTDSLNGIMRQVVVDWAVPPTTEIHAYPLFHGTEEWSGVPARARIGIYKKVLTAVVSTENLRILLRGVSASRLKDRQDRNRYPVRFPPEQIAFQHVLQRANEIARKEGTYALVIADNRSDRERHRERFALYQTVGTPGVYMHTKLANLLDTVHFAPSNRSRMLQAADVLAFTYRRCRTSKEPDDRAQRVMDEAWAEICASPGLHDPGIWP